MALIYDRQLGDNAPNYVEPWNTPTASPWATDYTAPPASIQIGPVTVTTAKKKAAAKKAPAAAAATKIQIKRSGPAADFLDKLLPLVVDQAGNRTIYGLPPIVVYLAGGVISSTLLVYVYRLLTGGGGKRRRTVSNPKRHRAAARRAKR